jgi:hypothetical protein
MFKGVFRTAHEILCTSTTKKKRLELFGEMLTVYYRHNKNKLFYSAEKGGKRTFLILNDSVHPARNLPEGFKTDVSEIMVELCFERNVTFITY